MSAPWVECRSAPAIEPGMIHLWLLELDSTSSASVDGLDGPLSPDERRRAQQFLSPIDRDRFIRARWGLRRVLAGYLGIGASDVGFELGAKGKPRLGLGLDHRIRFNVSHSSGLGLVAVSREHEVGVDIERIRFGLDVSAIASRVFSPEEIERLSRIAPDWRPAEFFRLWVRHEAAGKCRGVGLEEPPQEYHGVTLVDFDVGDAYAAAVAVASGAETRPTLMRLRLGEEALRRGP